MNRNSMNQAPKTSSGAKLFSTAAMMGLVLLVTQFAGATLLPVRARRQRGYTLLG